MTKGYLLPLVAIIAFASLSSVYAAEYNRTYQVNLTTTTPYGQSGGSYQYFPNKSPYCDKYAMTSDLKNWCHLRSNGSLAVVDSSSGTLSQITQLPPSVSQGSNVLIFSSGMYIMIQAVQLHGINVVIFDTSNQTNQFPYSLTVLALFEQFIVNGNGLLLGSYVGNNISFVPTGTSIVYPSGYLSTIYPNVTIANLAWLGDSAYLAELNTNEIYSFVISNNVVTNSTLIPDLNNFVQYNTSTIVVYSRVQEADVTVYTYDSNSSTLISPTNQTILQNMEVKNVSYIIGTSQVFINLESGGITYDLESSDVELQYATTPALITQNGTEVNYTSVGFFIRLPEQTQVSFTSFPIGSTLYNKAQAQMFYAISYNDDISCNIMAINLTNNDIIQSTIQNCPFNGGTLMEVFYYNSTNITVIIKNETTLYVVNSNSFVPLKLSPVYCDNYNLYFSINVTLETGYISCMYEQLFTIYEGNFSSGNFHPYFTYNGYNLNSIQKISDQYYLLYQTNGAQGYYNLFDVYNLSSVNVITVDTTFQVAYPMGVYLGNAINYTGLVAVYRNNFTGYLVDSNGSLTIFGSAIDVYPVGPFQFYSIQQQDFGYLYTYFEVLSWTTVPIVPFTPDLGYVWIFVGAFVFLFVALIICYRQKILCCVGEITPKRERKGDYQKIKNANVNNA